MEAWREELQDSELYHHGILGMKWYVRNGPPYPLSYEAHSMNERRENWTRSLNGAYNRDMYGRRTARGQQSIGVDWRYMPIKSWKKPSISLPKFFKNGIFKKKVVRAKASDTFEENQRILEKLRTEKHKSRYRKKWEKIFQEQGLSKQEAQIEAYKKESTNKKLKIIAALSIAAGAVALIRRHHEDSIDKVLRSGTMLQNINGYSTRGVENAYYASISKPDKFKYGGFYATQLRLGLVTDTPMKDIYKHNIRVNKDLRLASTDSARKTIEEMMRNDKSFQKALLQHITDKGFKKATPTQHLTAWIAVQDIKRGKMSRLGYEGFNASLVNQTNEASQKVVQSFYAQMRKKGYDAIRDLNDARLSGYFTKSATIVFNGGQKTEVVSSVHQGAKKTYAKGAAAIAAIALQNVGYLSGIGAAAVVGAKGLSNKQKRDFVIQYRKDHPNSKLRYDEITAILEDDYDRKLNKVKTVMAGAAIGAGVALGGAYIYSKTKKRTPEVIKSGTTIQTLAADPDRINQGRQIYTNYKGMDIKSYEGQFGMTRKADVEKGFAPFKNRIRAEVSKDVKVADNVAASKEFYKMMKTDKEFNKTVTELITSKELLKSDINKSYKYRGKYDKFNTMVLPLDDSTEIGKKAQPAIEKYYSKLRSKGFEAIEDAKDRRYSYSIRSKSAVMMFDRSSLKNIRVDSLNQDIVNAGKQYAKKNTATLMTNQTIKDIKSDARVLAAVGSILGGTTSAAKQAYTAKHRKEVIADYRKAHPNTNLTNDEIALIRLEGYTEAQAKAIRRERDQNAVEKYIQEHPNTKLSYNEILRMLRKRG